MNYDLINNFYFRFINNLRQMKHNVAICFDSEEKRILKENGKYKNKYCGKRCFIIGNGPSLKQQDLSKVSQDVVFTVNMFPKSPMYEQVKSDFHVMADAAFFQTDADEETFDSNLEVFKKINTGENRPVCFFPYFHKRMIEEQGLNQFLDISYFHFVKGLYEGYKRKMDLTKCIPGVCNVVQFAIEIAICMGFEEIYLLGCDMTGYEDISVLFGKKIETHVYDTSEKEKEAFRRMHAQKDVVVENFFAGLSCTLMDFRRLKVYCEKQGIHLYNATHGGILESLPRVDYNKLFENKGEKL